MAWQIVEFADRTALAAAIAAQIVADLERALAKDGEASLIVPGGTTPVAVFEQLKATRIAWEKVTIIPCDERWVAPEHADSNEGLIKRHLMTGVVAKARFISLYRPRSTPAKALKEVTKAIATIGQPFSSVFLGMGEDGHFASLFPGRAEAEKALATDLAASVMVLTEPAKGHRRIGLTLASLIHCSHVLLAVTGAEKRIVLDRAIADIGANIYPIASLLRQQRTPIDIFIGA